MSDSYAAHSDREISGRHSLVAAAWLGCVTGILELLGLGAIKFGSLAQPDGPLRGLSARHLRIYGSGVEFFDQTWKPDDIVKMK